MLNVIIVKSVNYLYVVWSYIIYIGTCYITIMIWKIIKEMIAKMIKKNAVICIFFYALSYLTNLFSSYFDKINIFEMGCTYKQHADIYKHMHIAQC